MLRSMTGFARSETTTPDGLLLWELRSINHRYLEVQLRLPESCRAIEQEVRQRMAGQLGRGRVEATLTLRSGEGRLRPTRLNMDLAREVIGHTATIAEQMGASGSINAMEVLRWPGVLEVVESDPAAVHPAALALLDEALAQLTAARQREGARLEEVLLRRVDEIGVLVTAVSARLPAVLTAIRERLRSRIESLGVTVDQNRLEQELAIIAQRLDVTEELDRLRAHLAEFRDNVAGSEPVGRRLDFLVQELNREANTLASKSADAETTRQAVDIKVLVEQIREQVQNVE